MTNSGTQNVLITFAAMLFCMLTTFSTESGAGTRYLYSLADFSGTVPSLWARLAIDGVKGEVYVLNRSDALVQIYNDSAMQTFAFGDGLGLLSALDIATEEDGGMFVLYRSTSAPVRHLDYRGELLADLTLPGASSWSPPFQPDYIDFRGGKLYLADAETMRVLVTTPAGEILTVHDFRQRIAAQIRAAGERSDLNQAQRKKIGEDLETLGSSNLNGFSVDAAGNLYFTIPSLFTAYRAAPEGALEAFGTPGSAPGKFGVVAGIGADRDGNVYVSDRLRCVVLKFDGNLRYVEEFGYRGALPENLVVPDDVVVDDRNRRLYVSQAANRGVSVFGLSGP